MLNKLFFILLIWKTYFYVNNYCEYREVAQQSFAPPNIGGVSEGRGGFAPPNIGGVSEGRGGFAALRFPHAYTTTSNSILIFFH